MNKKLLGVLGVAALLLAGNFAWQETKTVDAATPATLYLKPNSNWTQAGAKFSAYFFGSSGNTWVEMTDTDGDAIYEVAVPTDKVYPNVIFCRMNPNGNQKDWSGKWNQTGDLTIPTDGKNLFTVASGSWDGATNTWGTYTYVAPEYSLMGTITDWTNGTKMNENDGVYTLTLEDVPAGKQTFKLKSGDIWYGHSNIKVTGIDVKNDADDNCVFTSKGGDYTFEYTLSSKSLNVTYTSYADMLSELVSDYVVDGTYTKKTTINLDQNSEDLQVEFASLFHANQVPALTRTTYYDGDSLWMTNDEGTVNSGYGTSGEDMTHFKVVDGAAVVDYTVKAVDGMEGFYVTPRDFTVDGYFDGWTYNSDNKEYTLAVSNSDKIVSDFVNVVAPLLLDTVLTSNYITVTSLVAKETTDGLVLQIIAAGDEGKLGGSTVLAEATITKDCAQTWTF